VLVLLEALARDGGLAVAYAAARDAVLRLRECKVEERTRAAVCIQEVVFVIFGGAGA
jgi:hypothetical protein